MWSRRWCCIQTGGIFAVSGSEHHVSGGGIFAMLPQHKVDLLLSSIQEETKLGLRGTFRIRTNQCKWVLQAESTSLQSMWTEKLSRSIEFQLNQQHGRGETPKGRSGQPSKFLDHSVDRGSVLANHVLEMLQAVRGNDFCAECFADNPTWCSINLGVLICLECSGIHRSLGTHVSKVRSLTLDTKVFTHSLLGMMLSIGNTRANALWMATYSAGAGTYASDGPPAKTAPRAQKELWIRCKYADRTFLPTTSPRCAQSTYPGCLVVPDTALCSKSTQRWYCDDAYVLRGTVRRRLIQAHHWVHALKHARAQG